METILPVLLLGSLAGIVFDAIGSWASLRWKFPYPRLIIGSLMIYGTVGFLVARYTSPTLGGLVAGFVGLVDATAGWAVSWIIGPGRWPAERVSVVRMLGTVLFVILTATTVGLAVGVMATFL